MMQMKLTGAMGRGISLVVVMAAMAALMGAMATSASAQEPDRPAEAAGPLAAHRLTVSARAVLDRAQTLDADHAAVAEQLLAIATELDPDDAHAWHLRLEAAELAGDADNQLAVLRQYLQRHRRDDRAQLRLIDLRADDEPTVADRLSVYERLVGADQLGRPLRSRVAYRSAILHREQGRTRAYADQLSQALSLDESNPAAAAEALFFLQRREAAEVEMMQALLTLHAADPGNSATHEQIARRLLTCGQYSQAADWYAAVNHLWEVEGVGSESEVLALVSDWSLALWGAGEAADALGLIDSFAEGYGIEDPGDLPVGLQTLRVAIHQSRGDDEAATQAFETLSGVLRERHQADESDADRLADLAWAHLLFGYDFDAADDMTRQLETMLPMSDPMMRRLRIWRAARRGDAERAQQLLEAVEQPSAMERLGVYLAEAEALPREQRVATLTELFDAAPAQLAGVWAADRLGAMGARPQADQTCRTVGRLVQSVPPVLREGAAVPGELLSIAATAVSQRLDYGEPIAIDLELINQSNVPLSIGPGGAASGTVMLVVQARVGEQEPVRLEPQFVDMGRRLRLPAGRRVNLRVRLNQPDLVALLEAHPLEPVRISGVAVLNPQLAADGGFVPGVFGHAVELPPLVRTMVELSERAVEALAARMEDADSSRALYSAARLAALAQAAEEAGEEALVVSSVEAVEDFFVDAGPAARAYLLSHVLRSERAASLFEPLVERARADEAAVVQAVLLAGGIGDAARGPDAIALEMALARGQGPAYQIASRLQELAAGEPPQNGDDEAEPQ